MLIQLDLSKSGYYSTVLFIKNDKNKDLPVGVMDKKEEKKDVPWLYEEAQANVEIQLHTGEANGNEAKS
jgi:hypothetical protein